jgi:hypothetical protein
LFFDIVRDENREGTKNNIQAVMDALRCFTRLPADDNLLFMTTSAISRMLQLSTDLVAKSEKRPRSQCMHQQIAAINAPVAAMFVDLGAPYPQNPIHENNTPTTMNEPKFRTHFEGTDYFNNDILDLTYDLWLGDSILPSFTW